MIKPEVVEFFKTHCDSRGIPNIKSADWQEFITLHEKDDIRDSLAEYVHVNKIPFPSKQMDREEVKRLFTDFYFRSHSGQCRDFNDVKERHEYKYKYHDKPLGVIDKSHFYNDVSDYFQQENRMKCGSSSFSSPMETWNDQKKLSKMNWTFWRKGVMDDDDLDEQAFRGAFRLGLYTATQFRPSAAKTIYEIHRAKNVLDTSCGWGDRLAGFYSTQCTELYVGCDPNPDVFEVYKKQCVFYEEALGSKPMLKSCPNYFECIGKKTVKIWNLPSEDVDWTQYSDTFDMYFTSPPYFETEKYAIDTDRVSDQSWSRYNSFDRWKHDFFFKVTELVWPTIKKDGYMMINIIEPRTKASTRHLLCDDMVDHFIEFPDSNYVGKIGLRMMARPDATELTDVYIEPIWVFRKGNDTYPKSTGLSAFFD